MLADFFTQYAVLIIFVVIVVSIPLSMLVMSFMASLVKIRPRRPTETKSMAYESGMRPISGRPRLFNFRYYYFALLFVVFDVEAIVLFPVAAVYGLASVQFGVAALIAVLFFLAITVIPFVHAWAKGALEWQ